MAQDQVLSTPEERAQRRAKELTDLLWHAGSFLIINVFLWALDIIGGDGVNWAYWVTIGWGVGLAFHALNYFIDVRRWTDKKAEQFLEEERRREAERG